MFYVVLVGINLACVAVLISHEREMKRSLTQVQWAQRRVTVWIPGLAALAFFFTAPFLLWGVSPLAAITAAFFGTILVFEVLHRYMRRNAYLKGWAPRESDWMLVPKGIVILELQTAQPDLCRAVYPQGRLYERVSRGTTHFWLKSGESRTLWFWDVTGYYQTVTYLNYRGYAIKVKPWKFWLKWIGRRG